MCQPEKEGADCERKPASWSTFWRVYQKWRDVLRPRAKSDHAKCQTCYELQTLLYCKHAPPQEKLNLAHTWRIHLQQQYLDRQIYWALRSASLDPGSPILTIIIDSMDRKKTVYPKWKFDRPPKQIAMLGARPRVVVTAALAHGYSNSWYLAPDELSHGADAYCEVLCQVLQDVWHVCKQRGFSSLPPHLVLQADNTPAQTKNGIVGAFAALLVSRHLFNTVTVNFLMVGHTHEDVDQAFAILISQVIRRYRYETPEELMHYMSSVLGPAFSIQGGSFNVQYLESVRTFQDWLQPLGIKQFGCWLTRDGLEAPHSFTYKLYMDLTHEEKANAKHHRSFQRPNPHDVMCCVKTYMRDRNLQQDPLCVLPADRGQSADLTDSPLRYSGLSMSSSEQDRLLAMATILEEPVYGYLRAATAIRSLVQACNQPAVPGKETDWMSMPVDVRQPLVLENHNPFFSHLPETSWHMRVQVHRN